MIKDNVYDIYNHKFRDDKSCGCLTRCGNVDNFHCGTYWIFEVTKVERDKGTR